MIGPGVLIWSTNHKYFGSGRPILRQGYTKAPVCIGDNVWIGGGAIVLPGTNIGCDVVVGAGSVVRGEIPPGVLVAGVPAVVKRKIIRDDSCFCD
jgi:acetyltransferase-like isoleucine patch superfamily enzyme